MRIVLSHVTNSSSSSFVCWGVGLDGFMDRLRENKDLVNILKESLTKKLNDKTLLLSDWRRESIENDLAKINEYPDEFLEELLEDKVDFIETYTNLSAEAYYTETVGVTPDSAIGLFPDTKLSELEDKIVEELNRYIGENKYTKADINYVQEAWHD